MNTNALTYPNLNFLKKFQVDQNNGFRKAYINWRDKNVQNKNAQQSIITGFEHCIRGIIGLDRTIDYLNNGVILMFGTDIPMKLEKGSKVLSTIEIQNSYLYAGHLSSVEIISKRFNSIQSIIENILAQGTKIPLENSNLRKQLRELKRDFIILAETELLLLEKIVPYFQNASLKQMKNRLQQAA